MLRPILFLAGPHASGKTELATHLVGNYGCSYVDLGPSIRTAHRSSGSELDFGSWVSQNEQEYGSDFTNKVVADAAKSSLEASSGENPFIISGSRSYPGIRYLVDAISARNHRTMFIDAPTEDLYQRYGQRENRPGLTPDDFSTILAKDQDMGLEEVRNHADWTIYNCGSLATFYADATECLNGWVRLDPQ